MAAVKDSSEIRVRLSEKRIALSLPFCIESINMVLVGNSSYLPYWNCIKNSAH